MNTDLMELLRMMRRELWIKRRLFAGIYIATSLLFLVVGWNWPKLYSSSSTILVDQQSILQPLMEGTAVTTDVTDQAEVAREIIFSRRAMQEVLKNGGWTSGELSDLARERLAADIERRTRVESEGNNLIKISYSDRNPERAYRTARQMTDVFINHSRVAKQRESQDAYQFINSQVLEYHNKLQQAEDALKRFQSENIDARPGTQDQVNARIVDLKRRKEAAQLQMRELQAERKTLKQQLTGEAAMTASMSRAGEYRQQLAELEQKLAVLRLSYHDTYPDIVQLKAQMKALREALAKESGDPATDDIAAVGSSGELFQQLRGRFSETETQLATLKERLAEINSLLEKEQERMVRISQVEAQLAELNRDYNVNQDIYQSLLRQRENARISMNIDRENQGMTFQIQEPAALPLTPKGIRFAHFMAAGLALSVILPFGLIYGLTVLDQKVRTRSVVSDSLGLPVLASVYPMNRSSEYNLNTFKKSFILLAIVLSWVVYGYAAWLKING